MIHICHKAKNTHAIKVVAKTEYNKFLYSTECARYKIRSKKEYNLCFKAQNMHALKVESECDAYFKEFVRRKNRCR